MLSKHLLSAIFESVDEHHFLKNLSHSELRLQRYAEVAENSLGFIKKFSITKRGSQTMAYPEIGIKISASLLGNLSLAKVAYLHDSLRVLLQKKPFSVI